MWCCLDDTCVASRRCRSCEKNDTIKWFIINLWAIHWLVQLAISSICDITSVGTMSSTASQRFREIVHSCRKVKPNVRYGLSRKRKKERMRTAYHACSFSLNKLVSSTTANLYPSLLPRDSEQRFLFLRGNAVKSCIKLFLWIIVTLWMHIQEFRTVPSLPNLRL